jgi:hypothetical protein
MGVLVLGLAWFWQRSRQARFDAEWEANFPRSKCKYCGQTLLFYDSGHGNQIEYLDPSGHCYLWYPGNSIILTGRWRVDEASVYFQYGSNTYNPVTNVQGGGWEKQSLARWSRGIVDHRPGDIFGIQDAFPFVLAADPPLGSLADLQSR